MKHPYYAIYLERNEWEGPFAAAAEAVAAGNARWPDSGDWEVVCRLPTTLPPPTTTPPPGDAAG